MSSTAPQQGRKSAPAPPQRGRPGGPMPGAPKGAGQGKMPPRSTLLWFLLIYTIARRNSQLLFAVVPSGDVQPLLRLNHSQFDVHLIHDALELDSRWDGIVADFRSGLGPSWERLLAGAVLRGVPVFHVKNFVEQISGRVDIEHLSENTLGSFSHHGYLQVRQAFERIDMCAVILGSSWAIECEYSLFS